MNGKETIRIAKVLLKSHNWEIRSKGIDLLAKVEDEHTAGLLEASLTDQVQIIRDKALRVIEKIRGECVNGTTTVIAKLALPEEIQ